MAHGEQEDPRDVRYSVETHPHSADASQYRLSENEHVEGPPQSMAPFSSQFLGYAPWNSPPQAGPQHPGVQDPCYAVSCSNGGATGYGAWHVARYNFPHIPVMSTASQYTDEGAVNAVGAVPHHLDNRNPTGVTCVYAPPNPQANCMASQGPTPASYVQEAGANTQPNVPVIDAPVPSESLKSLARRLILDLGTHVNVLNMEASERGGLKVAITLETTDVV